MDINFSEITYLKDPDSITLKADYEQFLLSLTGLTVIDITGKNTNTCRVVTTLLHGNEPSGLIALHRWLATNGERPTPETNIRFIICSIEAASLTPRFSHRFLSQGLDLNRCFGSDENQGYYLRASLIEKAIREVTPEVIADLHNTSGSGPAFGVSTNINTLGVSLAAFFCDTVILSGIKLGALMEQDFQCPIITIECGGATDEQAHQVAFQGISQLAQCQRIEKVHQDMTLDIVYKPMRLQLKAHTKLSYCEHDEGYGGVTLKSTIEQFNFGSAHKGQMFGWLDDKGLDNLILINDANENVVDEYFSIRDNQLVCAKNFRIFMATTNQQIATTDCLFYIVDLPSSDMH